METQSLRVPPGKAKESLFVYETRLYPTRGPLGTSRSRSRGDDYGYDDNQEEEDLFLVLVVASSIASFTDKRDTMKYVSLGNFSQGICVWSPSRRLNM